MTKLEFNLKNDDISHINSKLSSYTEADYRPNTFRVFTSNGVDNISLELNNSNLLKVIPTTELSWCSGYFPDVVKFIFNNGYQSAGFPVSSFYFNNTNINSGSIVLSSDHISVYLTGQTGNIVNGLNILKTNSSFTDYANNKYYGILWSGINNANTYTRESCCDSRLIGSKLIINRTYKTNRSNDFKISGPKYGHLKILEEVSIPIKNGYCVYSLCASKNSMEITNIFPGPGDIIESTGNSLLVTFGAPVSSHSTGNFSDRIGTTKFRSNTYYVPTSIEWFDNNTYLRINPNTSCYEEGLHQIKIDMSGVFSAYGQFSAYNNYYSCYYIKQTNINTIESSGETTVPSYTKRVDEIDESTTYIGEADPGSSESDPVWRIQKLEFTGPDIDILWANGNSNFDNVWDDRTSLTYS